MKKKMGRPHKSEESKRSELITLRLTPDERRVLEKAARDSGQEWSEWIRKTLLSTSKCNTINTEGSGIEPRDADTPRSGDVKSR